MESIYLKTYNKVNLLSYSGKSPFLWDSKCHCPVHRIPPLDSILRHINSVNIVTIYFRKIHFNITLSSMPMSTK
jgi:hypothetical protein